MIGSVHGDSRESRRILRVRGLFIFLVLYLPTSDLSLFSPGISIGAFCALVMMSNVVQSTGSSWNATPVFGTIRSPPQVTLKPRRRDIDSATAQSFENRNVPYLSIQESSEEKILPAFGPAPKSNSAAWNRLSVSRMQPHSSPISSPLGSTEDKSERVFPLNEESSGEEEVVLVERSQASSSPRGEEEVVLVERRALSLPRNTPAQGRTPTGYNPMVSPEPLRASSAAPTPIYSPRPLQSWQQSDAHANDFGRPQGNISPRNPPARGHSSFEYILSRGRVSPRNLAWQQPLRRSPRGSVDRRPVSPIPLLTQLMHRGTPRPYSTLVQSPLADRQVPGLESAEETCYGVFAGRQSIFSFNTLQDDSLSQIYDLPDLDGIIAHDDPRYWPVARGGHSDIFCGKLTLPSNRKIRVAIKMIRPPDSESGQLSAEGRLKRLERESNVWRKLEHKNILPFIGVCDDVRIAPCPVLISPFCGFGHVRRYLNENPSANRDHLVFLFFEFRPSYLSLQVHGVASGLKFLHDKDVVHGDLKVHNVLVNKRGVPCICDFGISKILNRRGYTTLSLGTVPYMAPELFFVRDHTDGGSPITTKQSDVYSFALLALEILTAEPLKRRPRQAIVTVEDLQSIRPKREDYDLSKVSVNYWAVLNRCWTSKPQLRPSIGEVLSSLTISRRANAT
ncbi:kinase-like domain-containing protein [Mycena metata]|uniref:Kinase-like domain-containing protein n=1 Tax=Mycena metata TaxID=1033252 RepID=A0AAD7NXA7_9AGAR|nr:kinase-like domain-containing protein [Mycena metata]